MEDYFKVPAHAQAGLSDYLDYALNTGQDAKPFDEKAYKEYKQKQAMYAQTRVFVSWRNAHGRDCKTVGPATKCICDHRFKEHEYLNPKNKQVKCNVKGCRCKCYSYIPVHGSYDFKCLCKHSYREHELDGNRKCLRCKNCSGLCSTWSCSCNLKYQEHDTVIETRLERIQNGRATGEVEQMLNDDLMMNASPGAIEGFSDLVDGSERFGNMVGYSKSQAIEASGGSKSFGKNRLQNAAYHALDMGGNSQALNGYRGETQKSSHSLATHTSKARFQAQTQLDILGEQPEVTALSLFKKKHKFAK